MQLKEVVYSANARARRRKNSITFLAAPEEPLSGVNSPNFLLFDTFGLSTGGIIGESNPWALINWGSVLDLTTLGVGISGSVLWRDAFGLDASFLTFPEFCRRFERTVAPDGFRLVVLDRPIFSFGLSITAFSC